MLNTFLHFSTLPHFHQTEQFRSVPKKSHIKTLNLRESEDVTKAPSVHTNNNLQMKSFNQEQKLLEDGQVYSEGIQAVTVFCLNFQLCPLRSVKDYIRFNIMDRVSIHTKQ